MGSIELSNVSQSQKNELNDWNECKDSKRISYINKISKDRFYLYEAVLSQKESIMFKQRSFFSFEGTPRVIMIGNNNSKYSILIEDPIEPIRKLLEKLTHNLIALLICLKNILKTLLNLKTKYGCFYLTQNMLRVGINDKAFVWIHEQYQLNQRQFPLPLYEGEETMLGKLEKVFSSFVDFNKFPLRSHSISLAINKIEELIRGQSAPFYRKPTFHTQPIHHYQSRQNDRAPLINFSNNYLSSTQFSGQMINYSNSSINKYGSQWMITNMANTQLSNTETNINVHQKPETNKYLNVALNRQESTNINPFLRHSNPNEKSTSNLIILHQCSLSDHQHLKNCKETNQCQSSKSTEKTIEKMKLMNGKAQKIENMINDPLTSLAESMSESKSISAQIEISCNDYDKLRESGELSSPVRRKIKKEFDSLF